MKENGQPLAQQRLMRWFFEPGHSSAEFRVRHMMVTWVRGSFKGVHGSLEFDPDDPAKLAVEATIDATKIWTGEPDRDAHLRSADFLDVDRYPTITFKSTRMSLVGGRDSRVYGDLTIRGVSKAVCLDVAYLGTWETSWWEDGVDKGPKLRAGFSGSTEINRYDFDVNWNSHLPKNGIVVGETVWITFDAEAILEGATPSKAPRS